MLITVSWALTYFVVSNHFACLSVNLSLFFLLLVLFYTVQVINEVKPLYTKHLRLRVSINRYSDMAYIIGCARALRMQPQIFYGWTT